MSKERSKASAPVYAKIHTDDLDIEALRWYDIPWEYDPVSCQSVPPPTALDVHTRTERRHCRLIPATSSYCAR